MCQMLVTNVSKVALTEILLFVLNRSPKITELYSKYNKNIAVMMHFEILQTIT